MVRSHFFRVVGTWALVAVGTAIYFNGTRLLEVVQNGTFLSNLSYRSDQDREWRKFLFGSERAWGVFQRYDQLSRDHQIARNYGLTDAYSELRYHEELQLLSHQALSEFQAYQGRMLGQRASQGIFREFQNQNAELIEDLKTPGAIVGVAAAIYTGRAIGVSLGGDYRLESQTRFETSQFVGQRLGISGKLLAANFEYHASNQWGAQDFRGGVSRTFEATRTTAAASYGTISQETNLHLRQAVTDQISVLVDRRSVGQRAPANHSVGIGYSQGF